MKYMLCFLCIFALLTGCAVQEKGMMSYEESRLRDAKKDCIEDANSIVDPPHSSHNVYWTSYFSMCMQTRYGYTFEQVRKMRY